MPYNLIKLVSQNFKKVRAVTIEPKGRSLVEITGANGAGKSSACESVLALLKFSELPKSETEPLREGAEKGLLYGAFSEQLGGKVCLEVTRTFNNKGTIGLTVTDANKKKIPGGPQTVIDQFLSILAFRPMDFIQAKKEEQFEMLKRLAPLEVDVDALDAQNEVDYKTRHGINQQVESLKARIPATVFPEDLPATELDIRSISQEMEDAARSNNEITERQGRREREKSKAEVLRKESSNLKQEAQRARERAVERVYNLAQAERDKERSCQSRASTLRAQAQKLEDEASQFESEISIHHDRWAEYNRIIEHPETVPDPQDAIESLQMAEQREQEAAAAEKRLQEAPPLPEATDLSSFRERIQQATVINALVRQKNESDKLTAELDSKKKESEGLTKAMEKREEQKRKAISNAKMPIAGLTFGKGEILWNGHPLAQAGTAEKWRVAISICIAQNPGLKAILVRDGSLLDKKTKGVIRDMATEHGYTIIMEEVDETGKIGFVMEDGEIVADNYAQGA
jgi:DNA repair exonuclease SbcCD ATPase subunit